MTEDGAGGAYPSTQAPQVVISNLRDPEERARDMADYDGQCAHCQGIPLQALASMQAALARTHAEAETATVKGGSPAVSEFADLDPTPEELADLDEVLDEIEAEEAAGLLDDDELPGEGPWQDAYGPEPTLEGLSATLGSAQGNEAARQSWEGVPLPRTSEERFAQAMGRVAEGSYVPGVMYRPPEPSHGCGTLDEFGRCAARYHTSPTCMQADAAAAAAGGGESSDAWRRALLRNQETASALAEASAVLDDGGPGGPASPGAYEQIAQHLGLS
jgi:hypothetical protein